VVAEGIEVPPVPIVDPKVEPTVEPDDTVEPLDVVVLLSELLVESEPEVELSDLLTVDEFELDEVEEVELLVSGLLAGVEYGAK
jgi:hypothetical protein